MSSALALMVTHPVLVAVQRLHAELDSLVTAQHAGQIEGLGDEALVEVMVDLHRAADRVTALATTATYAVGVRGAARGDGFVSVKRLLEVRAGKSPAGASGTVAVGTAVRTEFRATGAAWLSGQISSDAVTAVTRTVATAVRGVPAGRVLEERARLEAAGVHAARTGTVSDVRRVITAMRIVVDPARADEAAIALRESQFLRLTPVGDGVEVAGFLTTETAAAVLTAFDQRVTHYHQSGQLSDTETQSLHAGRPAVRAATRERLNVDALTDIVTHLLDGGMLGTKHDQRPHVTVTVHSDDHAAGRGGTLLLPGFGTIPIGSATVSRILCDAEVDPVLTTSERIPIGDRYDDPALLDPADVDHYAPWLPADHPARKLAARGTQHPQPPSDEPPGDDPPEPLDSTAASDTDLGDRDWITAIIEQNGRRVIDASHSSRTTPRRLRKALEVRDVTCRFPGCTTDASRTQAHHVIHWEHGGPTTLDNLVLLCTRHHHLVHEGNWTITTRHLFHPGDPEYFLFTPPRRRRR